MWRQIPGGKNETDGRNVKYQDNRTCFVFLKTTSSHRLRKERRTQKHLDGIAGYGAEGQTEGLWRSRPLIEDSGGVASHQLSSHFVRQALRHAA